MTMLRTGLALSLLTLGCMARFDARGTVAAPPTPPPGRTTTVPTPQGDLIIAGTDVVRVGVNFEDLGASGDRDYNDAVMCFQGMFKVDGTNVVSTVSQEVLATTWSHSGCRHRVRVEVHHADGRAEAPIEFESNSGARVPMHFGPGSKLEVFVRTYEGGCPMDEMNMHQPDNAQVLLDRCNTTGE